MTTDNDRIARLEAIVEQLQSAIAEGQHNLDRQRIASFAARLESQSMWAQQGLVNESRLHPGPEFAERANDCKALIIDTAAQTITQLYEMTNPVEAARRAEACVQSWRDYCQEHGITIRL